MNDVYVLESIRTPRGRGSRRGSFAGIPALDMLGALQRELVKRTAIDPNLIEDVILGCASQVGEQGANIARTAALLAGWGDNTPGLTINRFCASGIDAVAQASFRLRSGEADLMVAGGVESVSRVPMFSDHGSLWDDATVTAAVGSVHMGISADLVATLEGYSREELDEYGVETQQKAASAWHSGFYNRSVVGIDTPSGVTISQDELIRADTSIETLRDLAPAFEELGGQGQDAMVMAHYPTISSLRHLHTVGTSPQLADAASILLLGTSSGAISADARPRARILASASAACDPVIMLTAGQQATEKVIARAGLKAKDIDVFEFAEAFAALCLRFRRDLGADQERMNPNGGTISMGHAFGATGAILVGQVVDDLEQSGGRYGVAAVSGAAGLGVAVLLERIVGN